MANSLWHTRTIKRTRRGSSPWASPRRCRTPSTAWSARTAATLSGRRTIGLVHTTREGRCQVTLDHKWTMAQSALSHIRIAQRRATGGPNSRCSNSNLDEIRRGKSLINHWTTLQRHPNALIWVAVGTKTMTDFWSKITTRCHWISK